MKSVMTIMGVGIVIAFLGAIMTALGGFRGVDFTETHAVSQAISQAPVYYASVVPPVEDFREVSMTGTLFDGSGSATIVLANQVLDAATTNISVLSTVATDNLVPYTFNSVNRQLVVNGFDTDSGTARTVTITYKVPRLDGMTDTIAKFFPLFLVIAGLCLIVGACYEAIHSARGG
jgi:hypothetical protein